MSSQRFPGLEITEWRSRLLDEFPRLFPDARPIRTRDGDALVAAGAPVVEDGWRALIEELCRRLDEIAAATARGELALHGIDEKYGELRIDWSCLDLSDEQHAAIQRVVDNIEQRSRRICGICGCPGVVTERAGWLSARCERHA